MLRININIIICDTTHAQWDSLARLLGAGLESRGVAPDVLSSGNARFGDVGAFGGEDGLGRLVAVVCGMVVDVHVGVRAGSRSSVCVGDGRWQSGTWRGRSSNWSIDNLPVVVATWNGGGRDLCKRAIGIGNVMLCGKDLDVNDRKDTVEDVVGVDFTSDDFLGDVMDLGTHHLMYDRWLPSVLG